MDTARIKGSLRGGAGLGGNGQHQGVAAIGPPHSYSLANRRPGLRQVLRQRLLEAQPGGFPDPGFSLRGRAQFTAQANFSTKHPTRRHRFFL